MRGVYVGSTDTCHTMWSPWLSTWRTAGSPTPRSAQSCRRLQGRGAQHWASSQRQRYRCSSRVAPTRPGNCSNLCTQVYSKRRPFCPRQVVRALECYLGITYIPDSRVVDQLLGVPTHLLHQAVEVLRRGGGAGLQGRSPKEGCHHSSAWRGRHLA